MKIFFFHVSLASPFPPTLLSFCRFTSLSALRISPYPLSFVGSQWNFEKMEEFFQKSANFVELLHQNIEH